MLGVASITGCSRFYVPQIFPVLIPVRLLQYVGSVSPSLW